MGKAIRQPGIALGTWNSIYDDLRIIRSMGGFTAARLKGEVDLSGIMSSERIGSEVPPQAVYRLALSILETTTQTVCDYLLKVSAPGSPSMIGALSVQRLMLDDVDPELTMKARRDRTGADFARDSDYVRKAEDHVLRSVGRRVLDQSNDSGAPTERRSTEQEVARSLIRLFEHLRPLVEAKLSLTRSSLEPDTTGAPDTLFEVFDRVLFAGVAFEIGLSACLARVDSVSQKTQPDRNVVVMAALGLAVTLDFPFSAEQASFLRRTFDTMPTSEFFDFMHALRNDELGRQVLRQWHQWITSPCGKNCGTTKSKRCPRHSMLAACEAFVEGLETYRLTRMVLMDAPVSEARIEQARMRVGKRQYSLHIQEIAIDSRRHS